MYCPTSTWYDKRLARLFSRLDQMSLFDVLSRLHSFSGDVRISLGLTALAILRLPSQDHRFSPSSSSLVPVMSLLSFSPLLCIASILGFAIVQRADLLLGSNVESRPLPVYSECFFSEE